MKKVITFAGTLATLAGAILVAPSAFAAERDRGGHSRQEGGNGGRQEDRREGWRERGRDDRREWRRRHFFYFCL